MADDTPDAVEGTEPPVMPDAVAGQEPQTPELPEQFQRLNQVLEAHDLTSPDAIEGLVNELGTFKKGYGDSQNEVGALRRQVEQLSSQLQAPQQQPQDPYAEPNYDNPQPINLKGEFKDAFKEVVQELTQQQMAGQRQYFAEMQRLQSQPNWKDVESSFQQAMANPQVQQAMQMGQTDMEKVYLYLERSHLLSVAKGAQEAINLIPDNARRTLTQAPAVPGDGRVPIPPTQDQEMAQARAEAIKNRDPQALLNAIIPDGDPITRSGI